jgi:DNA-binding NarL/FixJ family response regulator
VSIRILLVDDQPMLRMGFRMVFDAQPDLEVVGEAADGIEALAAIERTAVDVVLMDVRMPRMDGVEATRRIAARPEPTPRVVILTTFDLDEYVFAGLRAGASAFLLKDVPPEELLHAIHVVASGDAIVAPSVTRRLLDQFVPHLPTNGGSAPAFTSSGESTASGESAASGAEPPRVDPLTERERDVLLQLARGQSNAEIAAALFLSEATIKTHVGHILTKLGLRDRVQLVIHAYETGLIQPNSPRL